MVRTRDLRPLQYTRHSETKKEFGLRDRARESLFIEQCQSASLPAWMRAYVSIGKSRPCLSTRLLKWQPPIVIKPSKLFHDIHIEAREGKAEWLYLSYRAVEPRLFADAFHTSEESTQGNGATTCRFGSKALSRDGRRSCRLVVSFPAFQTTRKYLDDHVRLGANTPPQQSQDPDATIPAEHVLLCVLL